MSNKSYLPVDDVKTELRTYIVVLRTKQRCRVLREKYLRSQKVLPPTAVRPDPKGNMIQLLSEVSSLHFMETYLLGRLEHSVPENFTKKTSRKIASDRLFVVGLLIFPVDRQCGL